jgi:hypothetical protein
MDSSTHPLLAAVDELIRTLEAHKPDDRSPVDRNYAIALTEAQKLRAWIIIMLV